MPSRYTPAHAEAQKKYRKKSPRVSFFLNPDNQNEAELLKKLQTLSAESGRSLGAEAKKLLLEQFLG